MNPMSKQISDRLDDLESRFAFQDEAIASLNPHIAGQEKRIANVEQQLLALRQELAALRVALSHDGGLEAPPPHF
jgi:SlyX protein